MSSVNELVSERKLLMVSKLIINISFRICLGLALLDAPRELGVEDLQNLCSETHQLLRFE